jgi:toxin ParE1/3/4
MRRVVWSETARDDYLAILDYISGDNPFAAEKVGNAIEHSANNLADFATGRPGRVAGTYEKVVRGLPYIIAYAIGASAERETITILRVVHASRDWPPGQWPE